MKTKGQLTKNVIARGLAQLAQAAPFAAVLYVAPHCAWAAQVDHVAWFKNLVQTNNEHAFCVPDGMTYEQVLQQMFKRSPHAAPDGTITDYDAIGALRRAFPCHAPEDEYTAIDTRRAQEIIGMLETDTGHDAQQLVMAVETEARLYPPPVLFVLANQLFKQGNTQDALFWYYAGILRTRYDIGRCADRTVDSTLADLLRQMPPELRQAGTQDAAKLREIIDMVLEWDANTPYDYDQRWINFHGMNAIIGGDRKPLSVPSGEWASIVAKTRAQFREDMDKVIASASPSGKQPASQHAAK
ncbi:hypothetical protein C0Z18_13485 [Trinickia dabaoshanensis]|uniref:Sel1 repeat family protein n=1 Tax=Trinickia dabaoshanensis TaxID=564714 RepID=A0A2N7VQA4_9BURK|nr:hypothetical protein [Trinickia dabaoshanensis]PMS19339.1 hypothetical protein C0Z18_13485 [Trinickia dabaoshanensis]